MREAGFTAGIANLQGDLSAGVDLFAVPRRLVRDWSGDDFAAWLCGEDKSTLEDATLAGRRKKLLDAQDLLTGADIPPRRFSFSWKTWLKERGKSFLRRLSGGRAS